MTETPTSVAPESRPPRRVVPAWVQAEYERIGREREQAGREADRLYRRELLRVCGEIVGWTMLGWVVAAFAFRVNTYRIGMVFFYAGMFINYTGVLVSIWMAYQRGHARGDW